MKKGLTVELNYKIWNDSLGFHVEVGEDGDALDCVEIRYYDPSKKKPTCFPIIDQEMARKVGEALIAVANHIDQRILEQQND